MICQDLLRKERINQVVGLRVVLILGIVFVVAMLTWLLCGLLAVVAVINLKRNYN